VSEPGAAAVGIRSLTRNEELVAAACLLGEVWATPDGADHMSPEVLRALVMSGNYVHGAFAGDSGMVGVAVAFAAVRPGEDAELHSHVTGVLAGWRRAGIGLALKRHQREWALAHAISVISWTFDPLIRRNAIFNLSRLAATVTRYEANLYGVLADSINAGDESDRLVVRWQLDSAAAVAAAAGMPYLVEGPAPAPRLLPDAGGAPRSGDAEGGDRLRVRLPDDIEALRSSDPGLAAAWRLAVRQVLAGTLAAGGRVLGVDSAGDYVLEEGEPA
jgi:predicted GNAT superfamily acetyltransferase